MKRYFLPISYVLGASLFCVLSVKAEMSEGFLNRCKELGTNPSLDEVIEFGAYMRKEAHRLSPEERERGDRVLTYVLGTFSPEEIPPLLSQMEGVRSAGLVRIALGVKNRSGGNKDAAKYLNSTPEGIVDYFLASSHGTKQDGDLLFDLKDKAISILLSELERNESSSRSRLRMIGLITQVIRERNDELDEEFKSETLKGLRAHLDLLDSSDRKIAESYLQRIQNKEGIQEIKEVSGKGVDSITKESGSQSPPSPEKEKERTPVEESASSTRWWSVVAGVAALGLLWLLLKKRK